MAQTMVEHLIEKGKEQGIQLGIQLGFELVIAQGIEQGRLEAKQANILKVLQLPFDAVPESFSSEINSMRNLPRLDALFEKAVTAEALDEIDLCITIAKFFINYSIPIWSQSPWMVPWQIERGQSKFIQEIH